MVQAARCQQRQHRLHPALCDPDTSSERGHIGARSRWRPLHEPANAIAEGRRRAGKDHSLPIFLLGGLLGFGIITMPLMTVYHYRRENLVEWSITCND